MKAALATSAVMHAVLVGIGLLSLSAPRAFEVADVESLPVDIIPVESITRIQQGDKKAPLDEKPAPRPTERPQTVQDAVEVGDNSIDTEARPSPVPKPRPVETAALPEPSPRPDAKPVAEPRPLPPEPSPAEVPATELKPEPEPRREVEPEPVNEAVAAIEPAAERVALPEVAPAPAARPEPARAQTAKAPDRKDTEQPKQKTAAKPKSEDTDFDADEIAALLNREKASGGGAKRSTERAALGGDTSIRSEKLSQSEMDALRGQVQRCWNIPAGAADADNLRVSVKFRLDRSGAVEGSPEVIAGGGLGGVERAAAEAARRAVSRCSPYTLPAEKYEAWADVIVNFDPSEMF